MKLYAFLLIALFIVGCSSQKTQPALAVTGITVIDVLDGSHTTNAAIVIEGGRIVALGPVRDVKVPSGARIVDAQGKYAIPGLWDMHTHIMNSRELETFFPLFVAHGIVGIRDMGGEVGGDEGLSSDQFRAFGGRQQYRPDVVPCGPHIDGPALARTTAAAIVDKQANQGFECIKIHSMLPRDGLLQVMAAALQKGLPVVGHLPVAVSAAEASNVGVRTFEHLWEILLNVSTREADLRIERLAALGRTMSLAERESVLAFPATTALVSTWSDEKASALFRKFVANHTWQTATLINHEARLRAFRGDSSFWDDPDLKLMPKDWVDAWRPERNQFLEGLPPTAIPEYITRMEATHRAKVDLVRRMHNAGVSFLAGTDVSNWNFTVPGPGLHSELQLFVEARLTPLEALQTATINPARYLGKEDSRGNIGVGKEGDLVILDADPTEKIANTRRIFAVVVRGQLIARNELDLMLDAARKHAAEVPPK